uniref:UDENN domain-containing protein n=1 Tax=Callorhinchus milii TaxID=7868 RepID=A0A4W3JD87_CALMI
MTQVLEGMCSFTSNYRLLQSIHLPNKSPLSLMGHLPAEDTFPLQLFLLKLLLPFSFPCLSFSRFSRSCLEQKMLNQQLIISDPALDINSISEKGHCLRRRNAFGQSLSLNKAGIRGRNPSIRQKISEWEGKSELTSLADRQQWEKKDATEVGSVLDPLGRPEDIFDRKTEPKLMKEAACTKLSTSQSNKRNKSSVLCHIEKLEEVLKDSPKHGGLQLPGSCYIPQRQEEADRGRETPVPQEEKDESCSSELKRKHLRSNSESEASEPIFGTADSIKVCWASCKVRNVENVYSEPGAQDQETPVNPVPKPKRTFRYGPEQIAARKSGRRLPDLPPVPPPLPSSPPPAVSTSALGGRSRSKDLRRKSFEFEDMKCLQMLQLSSLLRQRQLDGSAVSSQALNSTVSEENIYEDIVGKMLGTHSQRLVQIQSMLKQTGRYRTLERDLMELQEWRLFEFFVVVALHVRKEGGAYVPEVTQQFPLKLDKQFKFMRETEDQLKAIPKFCFPDARDWNHICQFTSETFSFVLTGEDGSRRFGYCRRLLPSGKGRCLPEVYCIVSRLGCFNLFSKILDEVEKRRMISPALVQPFMRSIMEAPFPAPGRTITVKNFVPGSGNEVIHLCRPLDSRLEHVDFHCLFSCLSVRQLIKVFASLLLERRVIFTADRLSTLSQCCHAVVALLYPFTWQHTYIPVLPPSMIDIVCSPTPFLIGLLSSSLPKLRDLPIEEVLVLNLGANKFFRQVDDEDCILPRKLQVALEQVLERKRTLSLLSSSPGSAFLDMVVSEAFVRFFVEVVGHYSLYMTYNEKEERSFLWEAFRKSVRSKSLRRFLEIFMETQMFRGFVQEREMRKLGIKGLFEVRAQDYLDSLPGSEQGGMNRFLRGLGSKMKFLQKK